MSQHAIELGDVIEVLRGYQDNSFDAVLCDPPYGLSFMGKKWDYDVPSADLWREVLRVCKPGAPLIAFSGTRTYHRTVVQIEDAGFEIRDQLAWMYGSGFPKSLDVSKAIDAAAGAVREVVGKNPHARPNIDGKMQAGYSGVQGHDPNITAPATEQARLWHGYGTALKPAFEPAVLARKPLEGTVAANVAKWGVGALAIDACRIGDGGQAQWATPRGGIWRTDAASQSDIQPNALGRWPANVILDEAAGAALDAQSGNRPGMSGGGVGKRDNSMFGLGGITKPETVRGDQGGASRFFKGIECEHVNIAEPLSSLPSLLAVFARRVAATEALLEASAPLANAWMGHSTAVMQSGSALSAARSTTETRSIGERFLLESRRTVAFLTDLATSVGTSGQTDITKTIQSLLRCAFSVESAIFGCTHPDSERGEQASRFMYCPKANRKERDLGCEGLTLRSAAEMTDSEEGQARLDSPRTGAGRTGGARNHHPTVKPIALMTYLARLLLPPNPGAILVPFSGSGSEMIGALAAGWPAVLGIERESEYVEIARARLKARAA